MDWLPITCPQLGTWPATQVCALTGNWTSNPYICRVGLSPLSHTIQGIPISLFCTLLLDYYINLAADSFDSTLLPTECICMWSEAFIFLSLKDYHPLEIFGYSLVLIGLHSCFFKACHNLAELYFCAWIPTVPQGHLLTHRDPFSIPLTFVPSSRSLECYKWICSLPSIISLLKGNL